MIILDAFVVDGSFWPSSGKQSWASRTDPVTPGSSPKATHHPLCCVAGQWLWISMNGFTVFSGDHHHEWTWMDLESLETVLLFAATRSSKGILKQQPQKQGWLYIIAHAPTIKLKNMLNDFIPFYTHHLFKRICPFRWARWPPDILLRIPRFLGSPRTKTGLLWSAPKDRRPWSLSKTTKVCALEAENSPVLTLDSTRRVKKSSEFSRKLQRGFTASALVTSLSLRSGAFIIFFGGPLVTKVRLLMGISRVTQLHNSCVKSIRVINKIVIICNHNGS